MIIMYFFFQICNQSLRKDKVYEIFSNEKCRKQWQGENQKNYQAALGWTYPNQPRGYDLSARRNRKVSLTVCTFIIINANVGNTSSSVVQLY